LQGPSGRGPATRVSDPGKLLLPRVLEGGGTGAAGADDPVPEEPEPDGCDVVPDRERGGTDEPGLVVGEEGHRPGADPAHDPDGGVGMRSWPPVQLERHCGRGRIRSVSRRVARCDSTWTWSSTSSPTALTSRREPSSPRRGSTWMR